MKNKFQLILMVLGYAGLIAGCSREAEPDEPAPPAAAGTNATLTAAQRESIHVQKVRLDTFHRTVETTGTVGFDNDQATTILAPISGPVTKLIVSLGGEVKAGQSLALIESPDFAAAITGYRKALTTAKNSRHIADIDQQLYKGDAIARRDLEQAQADAINAEADRDAAVSQLRSLGVDEKTIDRIAKNEPVNKIEAAIRSPLPGTVVEKLITPGQLLQAGTTPCFTVADMSQVWVMANIFETDLPNVQVGDTAEVTTPASSAVYAGKVDNISAIIDPTTHAIGVRVLTKNPDGILKKQMYVQIAIHSSKESKGLFVPVSAVLRNDENLPFVYLSLADGTFERRRVSLGSRVNNDYEITAGLKEGDPVIVEGGLFLQFQQNQ
jgi:cobalt-zinc-cadmium efflux system membrane fusion protein